MMNQEAEGGAGDGRGELVDSVPYLIGGGILGMAAAFFAAIVFGLVLRYVNFYIGGDSCGAGESSTAVLVMSVFGVAVLVLIGAWLFRMRKSVAVSVDPADLPHSKWLRRRFTAGSMTVYLLMSPVIWVVILVSANCAGT
jgi:hypothetical protein